MSTHTPPDQNGSDSTATPETPDFDHTAGTFDDRSVRALTESMTVVDGAVDRDLNDGEYRVYRADSTYLVDAMAETCDCPDALHRGSRCKHLRRVDYARGAIPIPGWVERDALDRGLGAALQSSSPRIATADGGTERLD